MSAMRNLQKVIIVLFVLVACIYIALQTIVIVDDSVIAFIITKDGNVIGHLHKGINFVPQGIFAPIAIHYIQKNGSCRMEIMLSIPPLNVINSVNYSITIPVTVNYTIKDVNTLDLQKLYSDTQYLSHIFKDYLHEYISENLKKYLIPYYQYGLLQTKIKDELFDAVEKTKQKCAQNGILITDVIAGNIYLPDYSIYAEGRRFLAEMIQQERSHVLRYSELQEKLREDEIKNQRYVEYLQKISDVISKNKDVLKYIYIDKLADNVKVIVTSDKDVPCSIVDDNEASSLKKDFDNFKK